MELHRFLLDFSQHKCKLNYSVGKILKMVKSKTDLEAIYSISFQFIFED